jgi:hypothetical protein
MRIAAILSAVGVVAVALIGCGKGEETMDENALREEFTKIYATVRNAFAEFDLDQAREHLLIPPEMPEPSRAESLAMAEFLPKIDECRFLKLMVEDDRAAYYMESDLSNDSTSEVTVLRFLMHDGKWKLAPGPYTMSSCNTEEKRDEAGLLAMIEEEETLAPFPETGDAEMPPPPGGGAPEDVDNRKDAEVQKDLEALWSRLRTNLLEGNVDAALSDLLLDADGEGGKPSAEDAKRFGQGMVDLSKSRFLKLGWNHEKPRAVAYYAAVDGYEAGESKIIMLVFVYRDDRWWFEPGPRSMEEVPVPKTDKEDLLKEIETNPELRL